MTVRITIAHNEARLAGTLAQLDAGTTGARLEIYAGAKPAAIGDAPAGDELAEIQLTKPAGVISDGALILTPAGVGMVAVTGQAAWARFVDGDGVVVMDADCSALDGDGEVKLVSTQLFAGGDARLASAVIG